jgi:transglutaminase-like putative cysteine protease
MRTPAIIPRTRAPELAALLTAALLASRTLAVAEVSVSQIEQAVQNHILEATRAGDGYFRVQFQGKALELKLVRVHTEYLADLGGGVQFACVDLVGTDGPVYDVDFFMKGLPGPATVTETTVHKIDGQPIYAWNQKDDGTWIRVPVTEAPDRLLGVIRGEDQFEFFYRVKLPALSGPAKLWLPLARSDGVQTVRVEGINAPPSLRELDERKHGNKVLFVTLGPKDAGSTVEVRYQVKRVEETAYPATETNVKAYLAPERLTPMTDKIRKIAQDVVQGKPTDLMRARALYDHVIAKLRYAKYGTGWGRGDAVYACDAKSGNCSDFHAYFIALARSVGIPARFAVGASIPSERNDGGIDGYHCWAEFYADGKWWPVDVSEGDKNPRLTTYYFGHHPANRIELSRGRDLVVKPGPASGPINFLAHPVLEVEGKPVTIKADFSFHRERQSSGGPEAAATWSALILAASNFFAEASIFPIVSSNLGSPPRWNRIGLTRAITNALRYGLTKPRSFSAATAATTTSSSSRSAAARSSRTASAAGSLLPRKDSTRFNTGA